VEEVLARRDVLALLPTGGGKSVCFQVPAMLMDGVCIVVSPLIALMKDQVEQLQARGIKALHLSSEHSPEQIDAILDRCIYEEGIKFLYLSPERLKTDLARQRIAKMNVSMLAVDEAHCISEWGYDFRPPYLEIAEIRPLLPGCAVIALTASATPKVVEDIQKRLQFKQTNVIRKSFGRANLAYFVEWTEDKIGTIVRTASKQGGGGIVYMRSRKACERTANALAERGLSVSFYHAGLDTDTRNERQEAWMSGHTQVIVATNAFGMGIDKPNVRFVIHCDIPDTLENYYQECGRAGRDEKKAFALSLLMQKDVDAFKEKVIGAFPPKAMILKVYETMGSMLQLAVGSGLEERFPVDLDRLAERCECSTRSAALCLKFLEREDYIAMDERPSFYAFAQITASGDAVYNLRQKNDIASQTMDALLRSYPRLFEESCKISEWKLAKRMNASKDRVVNALRWLRESGYISYEESTSLPRVRYSKERIPTKSVRLSDEHYRLRKHVTEEKSQAMIQYIQDEHQCRSRMILSYFGENDSEDCGICDVCIERKR
jgi:ATP-dependent DNA helicase RecQ